MSLMDPLAFFQLKSIRAARVSEISESTAAASIPKNERINFHIGNPLQDPRYDSAFLRVALGLDVHQESLRVSNPDCFLEALGWEKADQSKLEFLMRLIQRSSPYMPRGGYSRKNPHFLIKAFSEWLANQQDPLNYETGEMFGKREIILGSGGVDEVLRVLLFVLSSHLEKIPIRIMSYRYVVLEPLKEIPNLLFADLSTDEQIACEQIGAIIHNPPALPTFLILGDLLSEDVRRRLRRASIDHPLFFIEVNDADNHHSLAREAKLVQRVIRLLTPGIFTPGLHDLSTVFVAGNADFLNIIENVHFQLKGTPSASEIELLIYLLEQDLILTDPTESYQIPQVKPRVDGLKFGLPGESSLPQLADRVETHLGNLIERETQSLTNALANIEDKANRLAGNIQNAYFVDLYDEFSEIEAKDMLDLLVDNLRDRDWIQKLQRSFLSNFLKHQPQYHQEDCLVASGSSRTALGVLGFHCGLSEVVIPDLSWSYEQCFPKSYSIPLTSSFELDVNGIIGKVEDLIQQDASWSQRGAVMISNPHNATGRVFKEADLRRLITYCLQRQIYVIDDLAYQNLAPVNDLPEIKTARQITEELVQLGVVSELQADRLITVHSISKTDSLAGARLAVIEIRDQHIRQRFERINDHIQPNLAAIFISYLFYRNSTEATRTCWLIRNQILFERSNALQKAVKNLPVDRNPYDLDIVAPIGSLYPLLRVKRLPAGLSLDWLASTLARRGVGLLPLATFAHTEKGFETGRTTFRLTLGGEDNAEALLPKTRRLLIDLNRLIAEEEARYNRKQMPLHKLSVNKRYRSASLSHQWNLISEQIKHCYQKKDSLRHWIELPDIDQKSLQKDFLQRYLPERLDIFRNRLIERAMISDDLIQKASCDGGDWLAEILSREFMKDSLQQRQEKFRLRPYDRTVHPTQMYSLQAEIAMDAILARLIRQQSVPSSLIENVAHQFVQEFRGQNVSIKSQDESDEILLDIATLIEAEKYTDLYSDQSLSSFLSFWSDWDGSNRPSGQGHRLIAFVVMENVKRMTHILALLRQVVPHVPIDADLLTEIAYLPRRNRNITDLLNNITSLTHQLEQRYRGILPFSIESSSLQKLATRWKLRRNPARVLWQHNDRYERRMLELRVQRRAMLTDYFNLNKKLRKQLYALIPLIQENCSSELLMREVVDYRDILQRIVITPRIHQSMITALDQFAIETTIFNMNEINAIAGNFGNPGMSLALQVSFSTKPEALISLDRKMRMQEEQMHRDNGAVELPPIWLIPLFEDAEAVANIPSYLERIFEYATQSRQSAQSSQDRFAEIISEVFIAGSDLSQQVGQAAGIYLYRKAKYEIQSWLAEHGLAEVVRVKLGSGEPMQRQGGHYSSIAGQPAIQLSDDNQRRFAYHLRPAARRSITYAVTPLQGVFVGGDLRTFQSNISEHLRFLPIRDLVDLQYHVRESQRIHRDDLIRASETLTESRMGAQSWSVQELERLTVGLKEELYEDFLNELSENFRHILYGKEEDVIGIHAISYFIGRSLPQLRDRPTSRRKSATGTERGQQVLANIAEIIPFSKQGSLLRAISHNQSQTVVLGVTQLSTGLFRALERYAQNNFSEAEREQKIAERLLPHLPVYEILHNLRIYHDVQAEFLHQIESAFPAGNSAFVALREDMDAMLYYLPLFQQDLLRRHGLNVGDFFTNGAFIQDLLPTLRPDLAVLLQKDLFNTDINYLLEGVSGKISEDWRSSVANLLQTRQKIHDWRAMIWDKLGESFYQRVQSFAELAVALYSFSLTRSFESSTLSLRSTKLSPALEGFFRSSRPDDEMRHFLISALEYLESFSEGKIEVPISIIRAMNDVERIAQIEESALNPSEQEVVRYCLLQIARLAGESG